MNINPTNSVLAKAKVLRSPELIKILQGLENGEMLGSFHSGNGFAKTDEIEQISYITEHVSIRNIRTLEKAELIQRVEYDGYIQWVLRYDPKKESIMDLINDATD